MWLRVVTESSSRFRPVSASQSSDLLNTSRLVDSEARFDTASFHQQSSHSSKYQDFALDSEASEDDDDWDSSRQGLWKNTHIGGSNALLNGPECDV